MDKRVMLFEEKFQRNNHTKIILSDSDIHTMTEYVFDTLGSNDFKEVCEVVKDSILFEWCEFYIKLKEDDSSFSKMKVHFETVTKMTILSEDKAGTELLGKYDLSENEYQTYYKARGLKDWLIVPSLAMLVCSYILLYDPNLEEVDTKEIRQKKKGNNGKKQSGKKENCINLYKTFKFKEGEKPKRISREIKCECWEVRGHYRHYRSGKVVFINPYQKGKQRNNVSPIEKIYRISKEQENDQMGES